MLTQLPAGLPAFFAYFGVAIAMIAVFVVIYVNVTPYQELTLMRSGNTAAAVSLAGALLGFAMPVANAIAHSDKIADLLVWGGVAGVVQILAYLVVRFTFPQFHTDIPAGKMAPAVFLAALSVCVGLINAACMTY